MTNQEKEGTNHEDTSRVVQRFEDRTEAELACGLLVSSGLDATIEEREVLIGVSESLPIEGAVGLLVPAAQLEEARGILAEVRSSGGTIASDVTEDRG